ncbi:NarK family nitrate/nitrite MFS transporter [Gilvimarinus agarilyticus]|uniref:NarK family nitrate/nitrite MFS transporter n=1 Tax=unclassified Gilvimarinus TaxID=2642066 RepID=UPI001C09156B|nr:MULTISPECIES: NarK family nitrate/nitrite MFS transporter [unclassified Gilvimarinus]MBU2884397.1 NarK family nitrate/nitrite MFS transporter [Gilvimarinus agarilyticus]MDO6569533.1 NarK family nitrate/nitrite MFS transporter [Gilvimarinus sp. 2_MG-2023]MDO6748141.1 NarK family nitrate/nitrite MFS transporter [Gilvimarinus sp. 1_MG-2023]
MNSQKLNLVDLTKANIRLLHLTWFAFFLTFVVWFSHAPLKPLIMEAFDMSIAQWKALLILNVALTIPARIIIGILVDKFGPRIVYTLLLAAGGLMCLAFASAQSYEQLALFRFLLGFVGAGFVIGIRLVGEWFPARNVGLAEGVYGGWGNFGSAAAAFTLPTVALMFGGEDGWRYAIACTGLMALAYSVVFYLRARNTPKGSTYFKPKKTGGLEVTSKQDFYFYLAMNLPMYIILAVLAWKLSPAGVGLLSQTMTYVMYLLLAVLCGYQFSQIYKVNKELLQGGAVAEHDKYKFKQVAILDWAYFVTFGSELAVVSMLPAFFLETFEGMSLAAAGALGAAYAFMNLVARPGGGYISDKFGRRLSMSIFIIGLTIGYFTLSQVSGSWPIPLAVAAVMFCSFFVQAGEGAVFAMVPLVKRRMTGQIAGMAGAFGNVGAVTFLTVYSFVDASTFFMVIGGSALIIFLIVQFLEEPAGHMHEVNDDGSITQIELT